MSNIAGAPLVTDAGTNLSAERIAELNAHYKARVAAERAEKEALKKSKKGAEDRKSSSAGGSN